MGSVSFNIHASALIVDIRNFTPNLRGSRETRSGRNLFCDFLSRFYDCCLEACLAACAPGATGDPPYVNSTGDGVLVVFLSPRRHFLDAYLLGILLSNALPKLCLEYDRRKSRQVPGLSFGIGAEAGTVRRVASAQRAFSDSSTGCAALIETYIGDCINIAARVEATTKQYTRTTMLISDQINWLLCKELFEADYHDLMKEALEPSLTDEQRKRIWGEMNHLNENLLLNFMHTHNLRGVPEPTPLFRLSPTLARLGRPEFDSLLPRLTTDRKHLQEVVAYMERSAI